MINNMYGSFPKRRFVLFGVIEYEASGGMNDVIGTYDTLEEARDSKHRFPFDFYHIFDLEEFIFIDIEEPL